MSAAEERPVGLERRLKVGSLVWLRYHPDEGRFEVVWNAAKSSRASGRRGLCCLESADRFWVAELGCGLDPGDCRQLLMQVLGEL